MKRLDFLDFLKSYAFVIGGVKAAKQRRQGDGVGDDVDALAPALFQQSRGAGRGGGNGRGSERRIRRCRGRAGGHVRRFAGCAFSRESTRARQGRGQQAGSVAARAMQESALFLRPGPAHSHAP